MHHINASEVIDSDALLRDALSLSMLSGEGVCLEGFRAREDDAGLMRRHLSALRAVETVNEGVFEPAAIGDQRLSFSPGAMKSGAHTLSIGVGQSTIPLVELVLPALLLRTDQPTTLRLRGGTHSRHDACLEHLTVALRGALSQMGVELEVVTHHPGFYPASAGLFEVTVTPTASLRPLDWTGPPVWTRRRGRVLLAHLQDSVAKRQIKALRKSLRWSHDDFEVVTSTSALSPGNAIVLELEGEKHAEVFTRCGFPGYRAESVVEAVVTELRSFLTSTARVSPRLTERLLIFSALAGGGRFDAAPLTLRSQQLMTLIPTFLGVRIQHTRCEGDGRIERVEVHAGEDSNGWQK